MLYKLLLQLKMMNRGKVLHCIPSERRVSRNETQDRNELTGIPVRAQILVVGKVDLPIAVYYLVYVEFKLSYAVPYWPRQ